MRSLSVYLQNALDLGLFKKIMLGFTLFILLLIPLDHFLFFKPVPTAASPSSLSINPTREPLKPLAVYLEGFEKDTLFGSPKKGALDVSGISMKELVKNYRLKGIVIMDEPEAIVSDASRQKSFFVKQGEMLGDLRLKEIRSESVVLEYGGEEIELGMEGGAGS